MKTRILSQHDLVSLLRLFCLKDLTRFYLNKSSYIALKAIELDNNRKKFNSLNEFEKIYNETSIFISLYQQDYLDFLIERQSNGLLDKTQILNLLEEFCFHNKVDFSSLLNMLDIPIKKDIQTIYIDEFIYHSFECLLSDLDFNNYKEKEKQIVNFVLHLIEVDFNEGIRVIYENFFSSYNYFLQIINKLKNEEQQNEFLLFNFLSEDKNVLYKKENSKNFLIYKEDNIEIFESENAFLEFENNIIQNIEKMKSFSHWFLLKNEFLDMFLDILLKQEANSSVCLSDKRNYLYGLIMSSIFNLNPNEIIKKTYGDFLSNQRIKEMLENNEADKNKVPFFIPQNFNKIKTVFDLKESFYLWIKNIQSMQINL